MPGGQGSARVPGLRAPGLQGGGALRAVPSPGTRGRVEGAGVRRRMGGGATGAGQG